MAVKSIEEIVDDVLIDCIRPGLAEALDELVRRNLSHQMIMRVVARHASRSSVTFQQCESYVERAIAKHRESQ